jgi:transmembrane sensor
MSEQDRSAETERVEDEAAGWLARLHGGEATGDDWLAFEAWLAAAPQNAPAYEKLEQLWVELDHHAEVLAPRLAGEPEPSPRRRPRPARQAPTRRAWLIGGAAVAASLAAAALGLALWPEPAPRPTIYQTARGETRQITLADGTRVHLNAASRIAVSFDHRARRVQMAEAEAVFDVAHDPARPFLIAVGDREVKVVGTEFNLRRRGAHTVLTVRRGVVEVRPLTTPGGAATRVAAGQQLVHHDGRAVSEVRTASPDAAFAWTSGQLVYRGEPLSQVAADLSRGLATPVTVADAATGRLPFTGVLVLDRKADVLRRLEAYAPIEVESRADGVVLRARREPPKR